MDVVLLVHSQQQSFLSQQAQLLWDRGVAALVGQHGTVTRVTASWAADHGISKLPLLWLAQDCLSPRTSRGRAWSYSGEEALKALELLPFIWRPPPGPAAPPLPRQQQPTTTTASTSQQPQQSQFAPPPRKLLGRPAAKRKPASSPPVRVTDANFTSATLGGEEIEKCPPPRAGMQRRPSTMSTASSSRPGPIRVGHSGFQPAKLGGLDDDDAPHTQHGGNHAPRHVSGVPETRNGAGTKVNEFTELGA